MTDNQKERQRDFQVVNRNIDKVDGEALVHGRDVFTGDVDFSDGLVGKILTSPEAHARIANIDTTEAEQLDGIECVLHYENVPRIPHTTAGQGWPEPSPYDTYIFDDKVRYVGDRVAAVAGTSEQVVNKALDLIEVDYEPLEPVFEIEEARDSAVILHDEDDSTGIYEPNKNIAANVDIEIGDLEEGFENSEYVVETECRTQYAQHTPIEPHITIAHLDQQDRLVLRTSTQVPFHVRRIVSQVLEIPVKDIRVIKPRVGGAFGVKQEVLLEDLAGLFALRTEQPVKMKYNRKEEFRSSRTRHPMKIGVKLGANCKGILQAIKMKVLSNTGAYGAHSLTVLSNVGSKTLPLYNKAPNIHFLGDAVYTNLPVAGAYRGYGAPQGYFALEVALDELAEQMSVDPVKLRTRNHIKEGETSPIFERLGEGKEGTVQYINSCGLEECLKKGSEAIGWNKNRVSSSAASKPRKKKGLGMAINMQGSGIPDIDLAGANLKMNEDGSFNLYVGATDIGTGSDTVLSQIAAEVLGVGVEDIIVYSSDTDFTPFDSGAYASSTTYVSGNAVKQAAKKAKKEILEASSELLDEPADQLKLAGSQVIGTSGSKDLGEIGLSFTSGNFGQGQRQISASASNVPEESPPPFSAHFVELDVDTGTGEIVLQKYVSAVDCGQAINPNLARGQMEGAIVNGIGYALTEEMEFSDSGRTTNPSFFDYKIPNTRDIPEIEVILVESEEPTGPLGAKSIGEIGINGPIPAIANAIYDACGIRLTETPFTPEKVLDALQSQ